MLEYILKLYRDEAIAINNIPVLEMIFSKPDDIKKKAQRLKRNINALGLPLEDLKIVQTTAKTGGGALPLLDLPSYGVALKIKDLSPQGLHERLRKANPPIIAIAEEDYLVFDARCLFDQDLNIIPEILKQICNELGFTS